MPLAQLIDRQFMRAALCEAEKAFRKRESPIGAVAVFHGKILARAHNEREFKNDPLGHAELILLKRLAKKIKNWRLPGITVYVTLKPCPMCRAALSQARIKRLVFGTTETRRPPASKMKMSGAEPHHGGPMAQECREILRRFFAALRR